MTSQLRKKRQITVQNTQAVKAANAPAAIATGRTAEGRRRWLSATLAATAALLLSQSAIFASDGPPPRSHSKVTSQAPRFFIGRDAQSQKKGTPKVATANGAEETHVTTSRGSKRNSKLQWRSVRAKAAPQVQQTAHGEKNSPSGSVLKNASAAPLPTIDPLDDPFGDRLAAQPAFEDDSETPPTAVDAPSTDDTYTPPTFGDGAIDESPPATRTPAIDQNDPFDGQPRAPESQPETLGVDEPTDAEELTAPRELSTPNGSLSREEQADENYRADLSKECEEGLQELRVKTLAAVDLHQRLDIAEKGTALQDFPVSCPVDTSEFRPRDWDEMHIAWTASGLCHKPLYFEERQLERYGHSTGPYTQPVVSAAHFFGSVIVLPYSMGLKTPNECVYALGHYRPGDCAPYMLPGIPFTPRAALFQAGAVVGTAAILP